MTPPFWPFKSKKPDEEILPESKIIEYGVSETNETEKFLEDRSHLEDENYKLAMEKLVSNSTEEPNSADFDKEIVEDAAISNQTALDEAGDWVENEDDGYWYRKMNDGNWDPVAYVKLEDGSFKPYS